MSSRAIGGIILILLGLALFSTRGVIIDTGYVFSTFWPSMFVIPLSVFFHWMYFGLTSRKGVGLLIPGGILFVVGIVCQISMLFDVWEYTWPGFIMAVAVGLFEFYWFSGRNKWLLIPINILAVVSILFFSIFTAGALFNGIGRPFVAVALIALGVVLFFNKKNSHFE
ncbi:hypothetical protein EHS13_33285 [Paenibacillus psychroresistens]|uniref:DUF5668 domain-containing protein n=1 Tax=Paenibacillus psychroresistens TaxID=1778678 RepID=A0A6B8RSH3_9BACL|nr:hypothetical protein [Paenibacillus psychroresistens]QGQ99391.1 hypothetical protein EHS13_33285 [Paenibacillus psychroresistens]